MAHYHGNVSPQETPAKLEPWNEQTWNDIIPLNTLEISTETWNSGRSSKLLFLEANCIFICLSVPKSPSKTDKSPCPTWLSPHAGISPAVPGPLVDSRVQRPTRSIYDCCVSLHPQAGRTPVKRKKTSAEIARLEKSRNVFELSDFLPNHLFLAIAKYLKCNVFGILTVCNITRVNHIDFSGTLI